MSSLTNGSLEKSSIPQPTLHITGHNKKNHAIVQRSTKNEPHGYDNFWSTNLYITKGLPVDLNNDADLETSDEVLQSGKLGIALPQGTVLRFADFAPGSAGFMHRTSSIDFGIVMEGNVIMKLDDGSETPMTRGDVAVQRATQHQWDNASQTEWARVVFILQDIQPLTVNGEQLGEDLSHAGSRVQDLVNGAH
ncbi:hypothetical protein H2200_007490 [Cladophialophora chaetospira]|uniref:Uncharacterized protein n=1 Tax=Cladophialophora chaetospira TaxID=386627 RepID=A0AA39CHK0_9EURO|nr:hypothetical protein H2200_007490 [Cladophialophora chaetospira]